MKNHQLRLSSAMYLNMAKLNKYWTILRISWVNGFAYPASFWVWRLRQLLQIVVAFSIWEAVFASTTSIFGYQREHMLTYIFMSNIISWIILASRTVDVVGVINSGDLSLYLVRPLNFFLNWFTRDVADKIQNIIFAVGELGLMYFVFRPELSFPQHISTLLLVVLTSFGGLLLYFFLNMIFGLIGFWSPDSWAPRFLFYVIISFTSGSMYPLDIFPQSIVRIMNYLPFPYLMYFQTKIWLEQLSSQEILRGSLILTLWICIAALTMTLMWKKGLKAYSSEGR